MKITPLLTDATVLAELGKRLAARRIDLQLTQAQAAEQAGIAKRTLERMEAGHSSQLASLIRVLRVLDTLPALDALIPEAGPRPMDLLKREGKRRQRASRKGGEKAGKTTWSWGEDP